MWPWSIKHEELARIKHRLASIEQSLAAARTQLDRLEAKIDKLSTGMTRADIEDVKGQLGQVTKDLNSASKGE